MERMLDKSIRFGVENLGRLARAAITRLLRQGNGALTVTALFSELQRRQLAEYFAATNATANLLGRAMVWDLQARVLRRHGVIQEDISRTPIKPLLPEEALRYFAQLVPGLAQDLPLFALAQRRTAFTLAVSTDRQLLSTVQGIIRQRLETGKAISAAPKAIREVLDQAGVTPRNPQYSELVFRTNAMDSYTQGLEAERQKPDVAATFKIWEYLGIQDGREGDDHRPNFGKYYPAEISFQDIRGPRIWNCRCVPSPVSVYEWERLKAQGARIAEGYTDPT